MRFSVELYLQGWALSRHNVLGFKLTLMRLRVFRFGPEPLSLILAAQSEILQ